MTIKLKDYIKQQRLIVQDVSGEELAKMADINHMAIFRAEKGNSIKLHIFAKLVIAMGLELRIDGYLIDIIDDELVILN